jgi:hypothetical protein
MRTAFWGREEKGWSNSEDICNIFLLPQPLDISGAYMVSYANDFRFFRYSYFLCGKMSKVGENSKT